MSNLILNDEDRSRAYCNNKLSLNLTFHELDEVILIAENYKLLDILSSSYVKKGDLLFNKKSFNEAFLYYNTALTISNNICASYDSIIDLNNKLAICKIKTLCYEEALAYLCKCYSYILESTNKSNYQNCTFNIALTYKKLKNYDNAILYINKYIASWAPDDNFSEYIEGIILKCNCYVEKGDSPTAISIYKDLINKFGDNLGKSLGYIYNNLGFAYLNIDETKTSLEYFDKATAIRRFSNCVNLSHTLIDKSKVYIKEGLYDKAIFHLKEGLHLAEAYSDKEYILKGHLLLEQIYINLNNQDELEHIYINMLDKLNDIDTCRLTDVFKKLSKLNISSL